LTLQNDSVGAAFSRDFLCRPMAPIAAENRSYKPVKTAWSEQWSPKLITLIAYQYLLFYQCWMNNQIPGDFKVP